MKQRFLYFLACFAGIAVACCAGLGLLPVENIADLALSIDWFDGFTGHLDGLAMATVAAAVPAKGSEPVAPSQPTGYLLTDDQLSRLMGEPTPAEVQAEADRIVAAENRSAAPKAQLHAPQDAPPATERVGIDRSNHWRKRTARYILAQMRSASNDLTRREDAAQSIRDLTSFVLDQPAAHFEAETREADRIIEAADIPKAAKLRIRGLVEGYGNDLHELRAVPTDRRRSYSPFAQNEQRAQNTLSDTAGGYLLPKPFIAELFVFIEMYGYARRILRVIPMTSKSLDFKTVGTKPVAAWAAELGSFSASDMTFGEGGMNAGKLYGLSSMSNEVEEDAMVSLLPLYTRLFGEALAQKEDQAAIMGDGTSTHGGNRGILDLTGSGESTVTQLASGKTSAADLDLDDVRNVIVGISKARRVQGSWLLSETTVTGLLKLKDGIGRYMIVDPQSPGSILRLGGYPLVDPEGVDDSLFPTDAVNTVFGAFGNFSNSLFGQRRGLSIETSRTAVFNNAAGAVTFNAFQQDATTVRATERIAIGHPLVDAYSLIKTAAS